jgi:hypothetical protein
VIWFSDCGSFFPILKSGSAKQGSHEMFAIKLSDATAADLAKQPVEYDTDLR